LLNDQHAMLQCSVRDIHCDKVGYEKPQRSRATPVISPTPLAMIPTANTVVPPLKGDAHAPPILVSPLGSRSPCKDAVPIAFASPAVGSAAADARTYAVAQGALTGYSQSQSGMQIDQTSSPSTDLAEARKRKGDAAVLATSSKRQATLDLAAANCSMDSSDQVSTKNLMLLCWCAFCDYL
jgi:hypothetical protein